MEESKSVAIHCVGVPTLATPTHRTDDVRPVKWHTQLTRETFAQGKILSKQFLCNVYLHYMYAVM